MKLVFLSAALFATCAGCNEPATASPEETVMASAPALGEPDQLAGVWILAGRTGQCEVNLSVQDQAVPVGSPAAPMMTAHVSDDCAGAPQIRGWRPIPLGLELTDVQGMAVLTFEQTGQGVFVSIDQAWRLTAP